MTAIATTASPPAGISKRLAGSDGRLGLSRERRERRGKPAAARSSSSAANCGRGVGRRAWRSAISWSSLFGSIARLPQLGHGSVQLGAGVRLAEAEDLGDLGIGETGEELERDQLALAGLEACERGGDRQAALAVLGALLHAEAGEVGRLGGQLRLAAPPAQLVEGGVAGDPEEPGARLAAPRVEAVALAVGALKRRRGHFLGRRAVAEQAGDVGVDVVAAGAVEAVEGEVGLLRRVLGFGHQRLLHARTTPRDPIHHGEYRRVVN